MQTIAHLSVLVHEQAKKYGDRAALTFKHFGGSEWNTVSWNQFSLRVKQVSNALLNIGMKPQEKIAVFSQNSIEYMYTDFGAYGIRVISVPLYATSSEQQIRHMITDAGVKVIFVGEQDQYNKAHKVLPLCPTLERIVIFDSNVRISSHDPNALFFSDFIALGESLPRQTEVERLWKEASFDDICNILYTSGTTGVSKGVILTHSQYKAALVGNGKCVAISDKDRVINFLPFTHIFERGWAYLCLSQGCELIINTNPKEIQDSMRETRPTCMCSVPRFWEKVYIAVKEKIDSASPMQRKLFMHALNIGFKYNIECRSKGRKPSMALALEYKMLDKTLLSLVRKQIGLDKPNIFPTAGATVSTEVEQFIHSIGIDMIVGYGLTESLATVSCDRKGEPFTVGSVGRPMHNVEVKIGENDEVLLKGPTITPGYFNRPNATAEAFDEQGYFHTGDAGYIKDGELFLKERIKDLFKTSNGKYIAPQAIEALLLVDKFIDQVAVIADKHKFVAALIVPEFRVLEQYAKDSNIAYNSREELCDNTSIQKMILERIDMLQQGLAPYERIKRITLLPHHFSMESGELTNTLKLKRNVIYKIYQEQIDKMYEE